MAHGINPHGIDPLYTPGREDDAPTTTASAKPAGRRSPMRVMHPKTRAFRTQYPTEKCGACDGVGSIIREVSVPIYEGMPHLVARKCEGCNGHGRTPIIAVDYKSMAAGDNQ